MQEREKDKGGVGNGTICVSVGMYIDSLGHLHD